MATGGNFICIDARAVILVAPLSLQIIAKFVPSMGSIASTHLAPDGNRLVVSGQSGEINVWHVRAAMSWGRVKVVEDLQQELTALDKFLARYNPWLDFVILVSMLANDFVQVRQLAKAGQKVVALTVANNIVH